MNDNRGVILYNISNSGVSLIDVNKRIYSIEMGGRLRISENSLLDILDHEASRKLILKSYIKVEGATEEVLVKTGLSYDEIDFLLDKEVKKEEPKAVELAVEEVELKEEAVEVKAEAEEVAAVTYYNWLKNSKFDKIEESLTNEKNVETLKAILKKEQAKKDTKYDLKTLKNLLGVK
jgi:hypothetical protein